MQVAMMLLAMVLLSVFTTITPLHAQHVEPQCVDEVEMHCGHLEPGNLRIQQCFEANINKFSSLCQTELSEGKADAAAGIARARKGKGQPHADAIILTNDAIVELTDAPGLGRRTTVDLDKRWGADVSVIASATEKLQRALTEAKAGGNARAVHLLEMAVDFGKGSMHKEARLKAQGALYNLCQTANKTDAPCDKVPKYGSYVAP